MDELLHYHFPDFQPWPLAELPKAVFSDCRRYRYFLSRRWDVGDEFAFRGFAKAPADRVGRFVQFIGLNPSTADETVDDNTIRLCMAYAKRWGFSGIVMTNLFAWRDKTPTKMKRVAEPIGIENNLFLYEVARHAGMVVCCWGIHGKHRDRDQAVRGLLSNVSLYCFGKNYDGSPKHPLYLKSDLEPTPWT